jgi:hypothetical protein
LDQNIQFDLSGYPSRACRSCAQDYYRFASGQLTIPADESVSAPPRAISTPPQLVEVSKPRPQQVASVFAQGTEVAGSVPADWSWSTF